jgi:hypothetical protein
MRGRLLDTVGLEVHMPTPLERALARFRLSGRRRADDGGGTWARISAAEFRAATEERLRSLEREVAEVKGRINGLIFVVAGAVITQVVLRLVQ